MGYLFPFLESWFGMGCEGPQWLPRGRGSAMAFFLPWGVRVRNGFHAGEGPQWLSSFPQSKNLMTFEEH
jgi:hypothetical protein